MELNKNQKKKMKLVGSFLSLIVIAAAVILAVGFAFNRAYGWFMTNTDVSGTNMTVVAATEGYELDLHDNNQEGVHQQVTEFGDNHDLVVYLADPANGGYEKITLTSSDHNSLLCRLANEAPGGLDREIKPGDFGSISFDIVDTQQITETLDINLTFRGISSTTTFDDETNQRHTELSEIDPNSIAYQVLTGHILLFKDRDAIQGSSDYNYRNKIEDSFTFDPTVDGAVQTDYNDGKYHYRVTFYWVWPSTFGQMVFDSTYERLHSTPLFADDNTAERAALALDTRTNPYKYFYRYSRLVAGVEQNDITLDYTSDANADMYYYEISDAYNNADQEIGEKIRYLVVEAEVELTPPPPAETEAEEPAEP